MTGNDIPRCATCKWVEIYRDASGTGVCTRFPKWEKITVTHHCGEYRDRDDPIVNPRPDAS